MGCIIPREVLEARIIALRTDVSTEQQKIVRDLLAASVTYITNGVTRNKPSIQKVLK